MAKRRGWQGKIPFAGNGNQLDYPTCYSDDPDSGVPDRYGNRMIDNFVFEDTLEFESCSRGRSSATFVFNRSNGTTVSFFMNETARLFPHFHQGKVHGRFTFVKRGTNYSCAILEPGESE